jgi:hypothetical protein
MSVEYTEGNFLIVGVEGRRSCVGRKGNSLKISTYSITPTLKMSAENE